MHSIIVVKILTCFSLLLIIKSCIIKNETISIAKSKNNIVLGALIKTVDEKLAIILENNPAKNTNNGMFTFIFLKIIKIDRAINEKLTIEIISGTKLPILSIFAVVKTTSGV